MWFSGSTGQLKMLQKRLLLIFANSIKQMTIKDAFNILNGADNAATRYLRQTTYNELYALYKPKIQASTEKKIVGIISTKDSWVALTGKWNTLPIQLPADLPI